PHPGSPPTPPPNLRPPLASREPKAGDGGDGQRALSTCDGGWEDVGSWGEEVVGGVEGELCRGLC
ncbi:hypothetical protein HDU67_004727, partial [Dinochytrium kinnereticum]